MVKKIVWGIVAIVVIGIFGYTFYFLYKKSEKKPEPVETTSPVVTSIYQKTVATGSIIPRKEVLIKPQVSGIIDELYIEAGQSVRKGDIIAKVHIIPNLVNLNEAENRVSQANISIANAQLNYDRNKQLFDQKVISKAEFQPFENALTTAKQELAAAENAVDLIKEGVSKRSGGATNTLIKATISGMVLDVPVKVGNSVIESNNFNEGTTIASVADMGEMIFEGKVDESEVGKIKQGMDLILSVGALQNQKFKAKLEYIAPKGAAENGAIQFVIKAAMQMNDSTMLRANYSANADIILAQRDSVLAVPESTLQFQGDTVYVEVEKSAGLFEKRYLKTGLSDGINIEVLEGISKTDKIKVPVSSTMAMPEGGQ